MSLAAQHDSPDDDSPILWHQLSMQPLNVQHNQPSFNSPGGSDRSLAGLMVAAQGGDKLSYRQLLATVALRSMDAYKQHIFVHESRVDDRDAFICNVLHTVHAMLATYDPRYSFDDWLSAIISAQMTQSSRQCRAVMQAASGDVQKTRFSRLLAKCTATAAGAISIPVRRIAKWDGAVSD
jgi:hypothetical protein